MHADIFSKFAVATSGWKW